MLWIGGIPAGQSVAGGSDHPLTIEQCSYLLEAEAVLLDGQGGLDRVDAILPAEKGGWQNVLAGTPAAEGVSGGE